MHKTLLIAALFVYACCQPVAGENHATSDSSSNAEKTVFIAIKYGKGGFSDSRSPIDKLGGGQFALMVKSAKWPLAVSFSGEYYTNSSDPTNPYEISGLFAFNAYYSRFFLKKQRLNLYAGAGTGWLTVPQGPDPEARGMLFDIEAGIHARLFWKFGIYGTYKYLYAQKESLIDFSEHIILLGIQFTFGL